MVERKASREVSSMGVWEGEERPMAMVANGWGGLWGVGCGRGERGVGLTTNIYS